MSDDTNIERIKEKIAKLMALATDSGATENEAETAMRHAEALMRKHAIDLATIHSTGKKPTFTWLKAWVPPYKNGVATVIPKWISILSCGTAVFTDCNAMINRHPEKGIRVEFQGESNDVAYAVWLQTHLQEVVKKEAGKFAGSRSEKIDFRNAMVGRIQERMYRLKAEQREALKKHKVGTGTALVVVDQKLMEKAEVFGDQTFGRVKVRKSFATMHGREAGNRVGFGRPLEGGGVATKRLGGGK